MGDFNAILSCQAKQRNRPVNKMQMGLFQLFLNEYGLMDMRSNGRSLSGTNKQFGNQECSTEVRHGSGRHVMERDFSFCPGY